MMEIVLDDDLNAERHMVGARQDEEKHQHRVQGVREICGNRALLGAHIGKRRSDEPQRERNQRDRGHALVPEMNGARSCRPEPFYLRERRAEIARGHTPTPALTMNPTTTAPAARSSDPTKTKAAVSFAVGTAK